MYMKLDCGYNTIDAVKANVVSKSNTTLGDRKWNVNVNPNYKWNMTVFKQTNERT